MDGGDDLIGPEDGSSAGRGGRARRRHQESLFLPASLIRPKRPLTGYKMFLKNFFRTNRPGPGINTRALMTRAAEEWQVLAPEIKEQFRALCVRANATYRDDMELYKKKRKIMKRPPSSFAMFVSDFWKRAKEAGPVHDDITTVGRRARDAWAATPAEIKAQYRQRYEVARQEHQHLSIAILRGIVSLDEVVNRPAPAPAPAQAQAAADADAGPPVAAPAAAGADLLLDAALAFEAVAVALAADAAGDLAHDADDAMEQ